MGSQNNDSKKTLDSISNSVSGDGRKFVAELKAFLRNFSAIVKEEIDSGVDDIGEGAVEQVTGLTLLETHTTSSNGSPQNNIQVDFDNTNITNYRQAQIWVKSGNGDYVQVGTTSGVRYLIEAVTTGETYTVKVVAVNKNGGTSLFDEAPTATITIKGSVLVPETPTQFYLTWDIDGALWEWLFEDNGYVDFFELRLDANAGSYDEYLLDRTRNTYSRVAPPTRSGTGYLFVRNVFGTYSLPATHTFNKPVARKPNPPSAKATLDGVVITMDALPTGYQGWKLNINGEEFKSYNRQFTYYQFSGTLTVKYCFFDYIGDGEWSDSVTVDIKTGIDIDELPEISYDAFDQTIKDAIDSANAQAEINKQLNADIEDLLLDVEALKGEIDTSIGDVTDEIYSSIDDVQTNVDAIVENLNKNAVDSPYTSITQTNASISALVGTVEEVDGKTQTNASQITLTNERIDSLVLKVDEVEGKTETNASSITQTAEALESLVYEQVEALDGKIATNASNITQTATEITALVHSEIESAEERMSADATSKVSQSATEIKAIVSEQTTALDDKISANATAIKTNASSIKQNADSITSAVTRIDTAESNIKQNTASIQVTSEGINSIVSKLSGTAEDSGYGALTGLASSIVQTNNSITSVVTELNKDAEDCSYSAITQLKNGIDLSVKDSDLTGAEIVSRINLSEGVVTIDGKWVHITGDTIFDNNVIVGGYIASDTIHTDHLKTNAVTTAKIAANAITADKINANSITTEKITDKSVTSVKIEDGAITTTKIVDGAISSTKIEGGAITTEHIQAGSIIGEHISAGAISADKLYAGDIDMTGALALVGGAVRLDEKGLTVSRYNGSYTVFDGIGINYYDSSGVKHATVSRMMVGIANHNDYVRFDSPWDIVPSVIVIPMTIKTGVEGYTTEQLSVNYYATDVTNEGFRVKAYTVVDTLRGLQAIYTVFSTTANEFEQDGEYIVKDIPPPATQAKLKLHFRRAGYTGNGWGYAGSSATVYLNDNIVDSYVFNDDIRVKENLWTGSMSNGTFQKDDIVISEVLFQQGDTIKITSSSRTIAGNIGGYASCALDTIEYDTDDYEVISTGTASFIVSDSISSAYTIESGL